jgi:hypothetical protein
VKLLTNHFRYQQSKWERILDKLLYQSGIIYLLYDFIEIYSPQLLFPFYNLIYIHDEYIGKHWWIQTNADNWQIDLLLQQEEEAL